jgi:hypothetical protein
MTVIMVENSSKQKGQLLIVLSESSAISESNIIISNGNLERPLI